MNSEKTPGLYIHIPFCLSKCLYCDFYSSTSLSALPLFLDALFKEMAMYRNRFNSFDTVYIGGGTPSLLSPQQLESILVRIRENFDLKSNSEITVETNPADLNQSYLESIREIGINRINIGVQSFDQKVLDFLGRRHSVKQAISAVEASRKAGFHNIGLDLIYGVPDQTIDSWLGYLEAGCRLFTGTSFLLSINSRDQNALGKKIPGRRVFHSRRRIAVRILYEDVSIPGRRRVYSL